MFSRNKLFKVQANYINVFVCQLFSARPRSAEYKIGICLERAKKAEKFQLTVNDLMKVYLFFLVHAVKQHIEQHCFLTVFGCQNVIAYASALTTT